jgi:hypothetical protein
MKKTCKIFASLASAVFFLCWQPTTANSEVVINEIQTGGVGDTSLEFIELYNSYYHTIINLSNWTIVYYSPSGTAYPVYTFPIGSLLSGGDHFLLVHSGKDVGVTPDGVFTQVLLTSGGTLVLRDNSTQIRDSVGWGNVSTTFPGEGYPAPAPPAGCSISRDPEGADTDDNSVDFIVRPWTDPTHRVLKPVPFAAAVWLLLSSSQN